jgi:hypothetical protein
MCKIIQGLFLIIWICVVYAVKDDLGSEKHCRFSDTVNITDGKMDGNGNIEFDGEIYSKIMYDSYEYIIKDFETFEKIPVESHIRGCICRVKNCVRICDRSNFTTTAKVSTDEVTDFTKTDFQIVHGMPICAGKNYFVTDFQPINSSENLYDFMKVRQMKNMYFLDC